jgi:hypothetical protein
MNEAIKRTYDDTPIEKTRCGSCKKLHRMGGCPNGNRKGDFVPSFFADRCERYEAKA